MMSGVAFRGDPLKLYSRGAGVETSPCVDDNTPARALSLLCCTTKVLPRCVAAGGLAMCGQTLRHPDL